LTPILRFATFSPVNAIDPEFARQLAVDLPHEVFVGVIRTFEADLARLVQEMIDRLQGGDLENYRRSAHSLAGAAGSIGARRLETLARQAMNPAVAPAPDAVLTLSREAKAALAELVAMASAPPPG
jgi:HPt (histidine-containing phosphotransfer) domain-containing protein